MRFKFHLYGCVAVSFVAEGCLVYADLQMWRALVDYGFDQTFIWPGKNLLLL